MEHATPTPSLQSAFQDFLKAKQSRNKQSINESEPLLDLSRTDPRRMQHLRQKFLEGVKRCIGMPYARRHHQADQCTCEGCTEAGRQLSQDPMCLDCCGLVRKVVRDMAGDLGFRLGPGNQAYQYDTLPTRVESHLELEPGDLIFYSGVYANPESRRYAFDMTHVEVFIGGHTGEATIGSRWRQKCVQEYPSYSFVSQRWSLLQHHYVKIDPWLQGVCEPQHPELWARPSTGRAAAGNSSSGSSWDARKYSIFNNGNESGEEADGDSAGG